jgi:hypothetical protein
MPLDPAVMNGFTGSEHYYRHWTDRAMFTDGVHYVAEHGGRNGAFWLLDAIVSWQTDPKVLRNQSLQEHQFWKLEVKDSKGLLTCRTDSGRKPIVSQEIEYTDFEHDIEIWAAPSVFPGRDGQEKQYLVLYLPSEH